MFLAAGSNFSCVFGRGIKLLVCFLAAGSVLSCILGRRSTHDHGSFFRVCFSIGLQGRFPNAVFSYLLELLTVLLSCGSEHEPAKNMSQHSNALLLL